MRRALPIRLSSDAKNPARHSEKKAIQSEQELFLKVLEGHRETQNRLCECRKGGLRRVGDLRAADCKPISQDIDAVSAI